MADSEGAQPPTLVEVTMSADDYPKRSQQQSKFVVLADLNVDPPETDDDDSNSTTSAAATVSSAFTLPSDIARSLSLPRSLLHRFLSSVETNS